MDGRFVQPLEPRLVLASVTLIAPTFDGGLTGFVDHDVAAMTQRLGGNSAVPNYTLTIAPNSAGTLLIQGVTHVAGTPTPQQSPNSNIIVILDYTSVSTSPYYPLAEVGQLVANYMLTTPVDGVRWAELPIHEMDLSRSCDLMDEISYYLGQAGVWVDQETYEDPHPIYSIGDPQPTLYDNVAFADCYWRTSGQPEEGLNYNGTPVTGAYNLELPQIQANYSGYVDAHVAVGGYYNGTIDFNSTTDGDGPVYASWYGTTPDDPSREQTGFYYSAVVGGTRPLSGVWAASGGTGTRTPTGQNGTQWPNATDVAATSSTVFSGEPINVTSIHQDRGASMTATYYLDSDQNPYDGVVSTLGRKTLAASSTIPSTTFTGSTSGVAPGTYWVLEKVADAGGLDRYSYSQQITITAPELAVTGSASASLVTGSSVNLSAVATNPAGGVLTYSWSVLRAPSGAAPAKISITGTGKARAAFSKDGTYIFRAMVTSASGTIAVSDFSVVVQQTATLMRISPHGASVAPGKKIAFRTTVVDQFGHAMRINTSPKYSIVSGPGSITPVSGIFVASHKAGHAFIRVEEDGLSGTAVVGVT